MQVGEGRGARGPCSLQGRSGQVGPMQIVSLPLLLPLGARRQVPTCTAVCAVTWRGVLDGRGRPLTLPARGMDPCTQVPHLPSLGRCFFPEGRGARGLLWVREKGHKEPQLSPSFPLAGIYATRSCNWVSGHVIESTVPAFTEDGTGDVRPASLRVGLSALLIGVGDGGQTTPTLHISQLLAS